MSSGSMNTRARWGDTVAHAQTLAGFGRPSPMSGDALPLRHWAPTSHAPLWRQPAVAAATTEPLERPTHADKGEGIARHVFAGERCIYCDVNVYDDDLYGPFECVEREPITYTTESGDPS